jgi:hypothetical protein
LPDDASEECVQNQIFPLFLDFASKTAETGGKERYDRRALGIACSSSCTAAEMVVSSLLSSLGVWLKNDTLHQSSVTCAEALSSVLYSGGDFSIRAYHENSMSQDIVDTLSKGATTKSKTYIRISIANLALPGSDA